MAARASRTLPWGGDTHDIWIDPDRRQPHPGDPRRRHVHDHRSRPDLQPRHPAHRPDVPRGRGQRRAVSHLRQHAGRWHHARSQHRAGGRSERAGTGGDAGGARRLWRTRQRRRGTWEHSLGGCESGFTLPDLTDTNIVWASCYGNEVTRYDSRTKMARSVSPWLHTLDSEPNRPSTAATGRRRWPSIRSTTTRSTTAAR